MGMSQAVNLLLSDVLIQEDRVLKAIEWGGRGRYFAIMRWLLLIPMLASLPAIAQADLHPTDLSALDAEGEAEFLRVQATCDSLSTQINELGMHIPTEWMDFYQDCDVMKGNYWDAIYPGCSWYCGGGPDSISAFNTVQFTDTAINDPRNAHDLNFRQGWAGAKGDHIMYHFNAASPRITQIKVANGYVSDPAEWKAYGRVRLLDVYLNEERIATLHLEDDPSIQSFDVAPIGHDPEEWPDLPPGAKYTLRFEIDAVYPGLEHENAAVIAEIYFDGIDDH